MDLNFYQLIPEYLIIYFNSAKINVHLMKPPAGKEPGPAYSSPYNNIKLSFRSGGQSEVHSNYLFLQVDKKELQVFSF